MIRERERAPDFSLPGTETRTHRLSEHTDTGPVVLVFSPFHATADASTHVHGAEWLTLYPGVDVLGVTAWSRDRIDRFVDDHGVTFPLLSDPTGDVAERYGVDDVETRDAASPPHSIVVIDTERTVQYAWRADGVEETPDIGELYRVIHGQRAERSRGGSRSREVVRRDA